MGESEPSILCVGFFQLFVDPPDESILPMKNLTMPRSCLIALVVRLAAGRACQSACARKAGPGEDDHSGYAEPRVGVLPGGAPLVDNLARLRRFGFELSGVGG